MTELSKKRPEFRNIHLLQDVRTYRLPAAGVVSILHRVSGLLMFLLLPLVVWLFDNSLSSEISYEKFTAAFSAGIGFVPGWFVKLACLGLIWGYLHHFTAGVRHLYMDATHSVTKEFGHSSAVTTLVIGTGLTAVVAAKLFGLF